jgi:hypothetical protein
MEKINEQLEDEIVMSPSVFNNGTDTSQSLLVSNRSNPIQQVKTSQNLVNPTSMSQNSSLKNSTSKK